MTRVRTDQLTLYPGAAPPRRPYGELIGDLPVVAKVRNVFLARTDAIVGIRWDERLRRVEHRDFFSRASGRLVCVQADGIRAYHARTPFDAEYLAHRTDTQESLATLGQIWGRSAGAPSPEE